jgi:transcriptional regulator with XRE-family HTH domain
MNDNKNQGLQSGCQSEKVLETKKQEIYSRLLSVRNGMSRETFAAKIGISPRTVQRWELDGFLPKGDDLEKIASVFNINIHWLVTGQGPKHITHTSATPTTARAGPGSVSAEYIPEAADTFRMGGPVEGFGRAAMMLSDIFNSRDQDAIRSITAFLEALWASTRRQGSD